MRFNFVVILAMIFLGLLICGCLEQEEEVTYLESHIDGPTGRVEYGDLTLYGGGKVVELNLPTSTNIELSSVNGLSSGVIATGSMVNLNSMNVELITRQINDTNSEISYQVGDMMVINDLKMVYGGNGYKQSFALKNNGYAQDVLVYFKHSSDYSHIYANGKTYGVVEGQHLIFTSSNFTFDEVKFITDSADRMFEYSHVLNENDIIDLKYNEISLWSGDVEISKTIKGSVYNYDFEDLSDYETLLYVIRSNNETVVYTFLNVHLEYDELISFDPVFTTDPPLDTQAYYYPSLDIIESKLCGDYLVVLNEKGFEFYNRPSTVLGDPFYKGLVFNNAQPYSVIAGVQSFDCNDETLYTADSFGVYELQLSSLPSSLSQAKSSKFNLGAYTCDDVTGQCSASDHFSRAPQTVRLLNFKGQSYLGLQFASEYHPDVSSYSTNSLSFTGWNHYLTYISELPFKQLGAPLSLQLKAGSDIVKGEMDVAQIGGNDNVIVSAPSAGTVKILNSIPLIPVSLDTSDGYGAVLKSNEDYFGQSLSAYDHYIFVGSAGTVTVIDGEEDYLHPLSSDKLFGQSVAVSNDNLYVLGQNMYTYSIPNYLSPEVLSYNDNQLTYGAYNVDLSLVSVSSDSQGYVLVTPTGVIYKNTGQYCSNGICDLTPVQPCVNLSDSLTYDPDGDGVDNVIYQDSVPNNKYYEIVSDVTLCQDTYDFSSYSGFDRDGVIQVEGSILDCNGSTILGGSNMQYNVGVILSSDSELKGCTIDSFNRGVVLTGVNNVYLHNNTIQNSESSGILIDGSSQNTIQNNTLSNNCLNSCLGAMEIGSSNGNLIDGNVLNSNVNGLSALTLKSANQNTITNNIITNNAVPGLFVYIGYGNVIQDNEVCSNAGGDISSPNSDPPLNSGDNTCDVIYSPQDQVTCNTPCSQQVNLCDPSSPDFDFADCVCNVDHCMDITESGTYILCNNIESTGTCINVNVDNVNLDCAGFEVKNKLGSFGGDTYAVNVLNHNNVNINNCKLASTTVLPLYRYGQALSVSGTSNNIKVTDSNISWKVNLAGTSQTEFENVEFEYSGPYATDQFMMTVSDDSVADVSNSVLTSDRKIKAENNAKVMFASTEVDSSVELRDTSQTTFEDSKFTGSSFSIYSNADNNDLTVTGLKPISGLNSQISSSNSDFKVEFENTDISSTANPFNIYIQNGKMLMTTSDINKARLESSSVSNVRYSSITTVQQVDNSKLQTLGNVEITHLKFGDDQPSTDSFFGGVWSVEDDNIFVNNPQSNNFKINIYYHLMSNVINTSTDLPYSAKQGIISYKDYDCSSGTCEEIIKRCSFDESYHGWVSVIQEFKDTKITIVPPEDISAVLDWSKIDLSGDILPIPRCEKLPVGLTGLDLCPPFAEETGYCASSLRWQEYNIR